jgi:regulatory protein YycH of two-component signal transduction system YycFG
MDMHIRNDQDKQAVRSQNLEQLTSKKRLFDIKFIKDMNSDVRLFMNMPNICAILAPTREK